MTNYRNRIIGLEHIKTADLTPHPGNWRDHPAAQAEALKGVLKEVGIAGALLAYRSQRQGGALVVIDGHLRKDAAPQEWPVLVLDVTDEEADYLLATHDPLAAMATADAGALDALLSSVNSGEQAVQAMLAELAESAGLYPPQDDSDAEPQIDRAEELREQWGVEPGQMWRLPSRVEGQEHRLICGDCTDAAVVGRVMNGERAAITFTSPPYNAGVSAQLSGNTSIDDNLYRDEYDDNKTQADYLGLLRSFTDAALPVCEFVFVNLQFLAGNKTAFVDYLSAYKNKLADIAVWDKKHAAPQQALRVMDSRFEFVVVLSHTATRAIGTREFRGMVHNVYEGSPQRHNEFASSHAATFPVDFPQHFIEIFTNRNELVFEPFTGTGTTIIAAENLSRQCRAVEISPAYVAVALQRYADAFGITPELID